MLKSDVGLKSPILSSAMRASRAIRVYNNQYSSHNLRIIKEGDDSGCSPGEKKRRERRK